MSLPPPGPEVNADCGHIWMHCDEDELDLVFNELGVDRLVLPMHVEDMRTAERILGKIDRLRGKRKRVQ